MVSYKYYCYQIKLMYHSCLWVYAQRLRGALPSLRARQRAGARAPRMPDLGLVYDGLHLLHAFASRHRLARVLPPTPLRRRREPITPRPEGGSVISHPMIMAIFCPFRNSESKYGVLLVNDIPSYRRPRPLDVGRPRTGGARKKSGRVEPTWSCLWVSVETVGERCTPTKQISSGKKWLGRGQVVSPRQIYEPCRVKNRLYGINNYVDIEEIYLTFTVIY